MRRLIVFCVCVSVVVCVGAGDQVRGQQEPDDATGNQLVAPELILQFKEQLKLSSDQQSAIQGLVDDAKEKFPELQEKLNTQREALQDMLQTDLSDEKAVLDQLDKVIVQERNIRRLQLALVLRAYNQLNTQQQADAQKIREELVNQRRAQQERIQSKLQRVQQLLQQKAAAGNPPTDIVEMLQPLRQLLKEGNGQQAEALLDQALNRLVPDTSELFPDSDLLPQ